VPAESPELVIVVVLDEPQSSIYGGSTAAPIFKDIVAAALPMLGIAPVMDHAQQQYAQDDSDWQMMDASVSHDISQYQLQSLYGLSLREVRRFAMHYDVQLHIHGQGWVVKSKPENPQTLASGDGLEVWLNE